MNSWAVLASPFLNRSSRSLIAMAVLGRVVDRASRILRVDATGGLTVASEIHRAVDARRRRIRRPWPVGAVPGRSPGVVIAPTQRPGRSGAWKSEPAIGTRPSRRPSRAAAAEPGGRSRARRPRSPRGPPSASVSERRQPEIIGRMGQPGDAARAADQGDRLGARRAGAWAPRPGRRRRGSGRTPRDGRRPGRSAPASRPGAGGRASRGGRPRASASRSTRRPSVGQPLDHRREPVARGRRGAVAGRDRSAGSSSRTKWPRMWSSRPSQLGGQLDPGDQLDAQPVGLGPGDGEGRERVVVGDRQRRQARRSAAASTTSQGEQTPSECVVWTCRSAPAGRGPSDPRSEPDAIGLGSPQVAARSARGRARSAGSARRSSGPGSASPRRPPAASALGGDWRPVEDAVDEPARLRGAVPLGQLEGLVDGDLGRARRGRRASRRRRAGGCCGRWRPSGRAASSRRPRRSARRSGAGARRTPAIRASANSTSFWSPQEPPVDELADLGGGRCPGFCSIW